MMQFVFTFVSLVILLPLANAEPLSQEAIYNRCFAQLTGHRLADDDANLAKLRSGKLKAVDACLELLDTALLKRSGDNLTLAKNTEIGRSVLARMHELHTTFFSEKNFTSPEPGLTPTTALMDFMDPSAPALYYDRALFGPGVKAASILTFNRALRPNRTNMSPTVGYFRKANKSGFFYSNNFRFAAQGELTGMLEMAGGTETLATPSSGSINLSRTLGGGFLGTGAYLLESVNDDFEFVTNVERMPRRWSSSVYRDVLCREFPVVRLEDAAPHVRPSSTLPFRREKACNQCHASMDRTGSVLRNFKYFYVADKTKVDKRGVMFFDTHYVTEKAESGWPDKRDNDFKNRPTNGVLFFRSATTGALEQDAVTSVNDLGAKLSVQDDFFLCMANRYYDYFTSKGIKLMDGSELNSQAASDKSGAFKSRLDKVRSLARDLKKSQDVRGLIEDIIRSSEYSDSAFGQ